MRAVVNDLGCRDITIGYGQTEASPIITQTRTDDPLQLRVETVGRPLPGVEVQIVDPASGSVLGRVCSSCETSHVSTCPAIGLRANSSCC